MRENGDGDRKLGGDSSAGDWSRIDCARAISTPGRLDHFTPDIAAYDLPNEGHVLFGRPAPAIKLQGGSHIVETFECGFVTNNQRAIDWNFQPRSMV